jgi:hypothetical protein
VDACSSYYEVVILYALADLFILKDSVHYDGEAKYEEYDAHKINLPSPLLSVDIS